MGTSRVARFIVRNWFGKREMSLSCVTKDSRASNSDTKYRSSRILTSYNFAASPNFSANTFMDGSFCNIINV